MRRRNAGTCPAVQALTACVRGGLSSGLSRAVIGCSRGPLAAAAPKRAFASSTPAEWRKVRNDAAEVLTREINDEHSSMEQGAVPMPQLEDLMFKLHHEVGHNEVVLSHEHDDGSLVRVLFLANSEEAQGEADGAESGAESEGGFNELSGSENEVSEHEGSEEEAELPFTVTVSYPKEKNRGVMVYKCCYVYSADEIILENVAFVPNLASVASLGQPQSTYIGDKLSHYNGPKLDDLDEDVQTALFKYLLSRHVDTKLCQFMLHYSYYKEQLEYMEWLARFKKFVE